MIQPKLSGWVMAAAMLFSVFVAGLLGGAAVTEFRRPEPQLRAFRFGSGDGRGPGSEGRGGPRPDGRGRPDGGPGMPGRVPMLPPGVLDRLNLTEEQRAAVDEVLVRRREDTEAVLQAVYPQLRAQVDSASMEIRALLTPEQQETFDRLREEFPPLGSIRRGDGGPRPPRD